MATDKDIKDPVDDKVLDDQELDADGQDHDSQEDEAPKDVRGALRAAFKEASEKGDDDKSEDDDSRRRDKANEEADKKDNKGIKKSSEARRERTEGQQSDKEAKPEVKEVKTEDKTEPPPFYKTKGKTVWDKLSPEDKNLIIAREQEVSQGFAQVSPKVRAFDELEKVISPRLSAIQKFGASPPEVIEKLFQWMEALSHPDENARAGSFKQLAANFGVKLAQLEETRHDGTDPTVTEDQNQPPAWAQGIVGEVTSLKQTLENQQKAAADTAVTNWAQAKSSDGTPLRPHYSKVNELMYKLMMSGTVPLKDGQLDLDGAYEAACKLSPEVIALIQQEQEAKSQKEIQDKAVKDAQLAKARLEKAKRAGVGLKPAAPSMASPQGNKKPNGVGTSTSVRDSLRQSLDELRDS